MNNPGQTSRSPESTDPVGSGGLLEVTTHVVQVASCIRIGA
jgi:hypothetical protein